VTPKGHAAEVLAAVKEIWGKTEATSAA